jgi:TetR/AcrR family transcriptional regulator, regulator of autoinduction and epiphytic fitness
VLIDYGTTIANHVAVSSTDDRATRSYRSSRRAAGARRTRRRILEAAGSVFVAAGYSGATIRGIAAQAGVSVPTVELLFGTKARLLKAAIDVAIAGDDEAVPVLDRGWTGAATASTSAEEFLSIVATVIGAAQARSAGLVLAVFEGSLKDPELAELTEQMIQQRAITAGWIVDGLAGKADLRDELTRQDAVDTMWLLMEPAVFQRLVRHRHWTVDRYQNWFARTARRLLVADTPVSGSKPTRRRRST